MSRFFFIPVLENAHDYPITFFQAKSPQTLLSFLVRTVLWLSDNFGCPLIHLFQLHHMLPEVWQPEQYIVYQMGLDHWLYRGQYNVSSFILYPFRMDPSMDFAFITAARHVNVFLELFTLNPTSLSWFIINTVVLITFAEYQRRRSASPDPKCSAEIMWKYESYAGWMKSQLQIKRQ